MKKYQVILASKSPRRREMLEALGIKFKVISADADESSDITDPAELVRNLSLRKAQAVRELMISRGELNEDTLIIASDTVVVTDGEILGKPKDEEDAVRMLTSLSGREHRVISGVAVITGERQGCDAEQTIVRFSALEHKDILRYVESKEPMDKAGGYAVQGTAALWIEGIVGDYHNVVGLPIYRLNCLLKDMLGIQLIDLK